jgi:acyl dehydratase
VISDPTDNQALHYFEDLSVGQRYETGTHEIDEQQVIEFAAQFDPQPFHMDPRPAQDSFFGGLVASGWHTAAITMRLMVESGLAINGGLIGLAAEITWPKPTRPGAIVKVQSEILKLKASRSRPDRGIATIKSETLNQFGETLQVLVAKVIVPRRPPTGRGPG